MIDTVKRTVTVEITIEVTADVEYHRERDDDGCGSPGATGNSMTGRRSGRHIEIDSVSWNPSGTEKSEALDQLLTAVGEELNSDAEREGITDELGGEATS